MKQKKNYMQASRARKAKAGYVRFEAWLKPSWIPKVKKYIQSLKGETQ